MLGRAGAEVQVIMTERAQAFVGPLTFEAVSGRPVVTRWNQSTSGQIDHVEWGYQADVLVVAPATANRLAELALGLAHDALGATALSFEGPFIVAPAMESRMWNHPATQQHVETLVRRGATIVGPEDGELASGRSGAGRLAEPETIFRTVERSVGSLDLKGKVFVVTAGPTREPLDPVRFLSSRSTGTFGIAIAEEAVRRGARVRLLLGPSPLRPRPHPLLETVRVETAVEMDRATQERLRDVDVFIAAAAVSDFRPRHRHRAKFKKDDPSADHLELELNPDVLARAAAALKDRRSKALVVGFAAETEDVEANARAKRIGKGCDFVVANAVGEEVGFGDAPTTLIWLGETTRIAFGPGSKTEASTFVLDRIVEAISARNG